MIGHRDAGGGIVQNALDAGVHKLGGRALCAFRRNGDDADFNAQFGHLFHERLGAVDFQPVELFADFERIAIERAHDGEAVPTKFLVIEQSPAHVAHTHEGGAPFAVGVEAGFDDFQQIRHIIAYAANAEFAEVGKILTNLRGVHIARPGKGFGRNDLDAILVHGFKNLKIGGEPLNGSAGDMFVFGSLVHVFAG